MRFLVDECTGPVVAQWLRDQSHDVFSIFEEARGMADDEILAKAYSEERILITNDKDFAKWSAVKNDRIMASFSFGSGTNVPSQRLMHLKNYWMVTYTNSQTRSWS